MVDNFLKYLAFEKRSSDHTIKAYKEDLLQLSNFLVTTFEISSLQDAGHVHLRNWVIQLMEEKLSPSSINRKIACLKSFYKFLLAREYVPTNPATRLKPLKTEKRLPSFIKEDEITTLLDQIPFDVNSFSDTRNKLILELLYGSGIRLAELIGLEMEDISFFDKTIKVLGKRNKERIIPIPDSVVNTIRVYAALRQPMVGENIKNLLVTDQGDPLYPMFVYRVVKKSLTLVSTITKKSPHVLRHTFATHLLNNGADLNAVKDLLGHSSLAATQVYTHNSLEKLKTTFDQAHPKA